MAEGGQIEAGLDVSSDMTGECIIIRSCEPCMRKQSVSTASVICKVCNEHLCGPCSKLHLIYKPGQHELVVIENVDSAPAVVNMKGMDMCQEHGKKIKFFCEDHSKLCCNTCAFIHRKCDNVDELANLSSHEGLELKDLHKMLLKLENESGSIIAQCKLSEDVINETIANLPKQIDEMKDRIIELFDKAKTKMIVEADNFKAEEIKQLDERNKASSKLNEDIHELQVSSALVEHGTAQQKYIITKIIPERIKDIETHITEQRSKHITSTVSLDCSKQLLSLLKEEADIAQLKVERHFTHTALPVPATTSTSNLSTQTMQVRTLRINYARCHAPLAVEETRKSFKKLIGDLPSPETLDPPRLLEKFIELEIKRTEEIAKGLPKLFPTRDPRLQNIVVYMLHCKCHNNHALYMLIEQVAEGFSETAEMIGEKKVQQCAAALIKKQREEKQESNVAIEQNLQMWHETYQKYLKSALLFVKGITLYFDEKHLQSLPYLLHAHLLTLDLTKKHPNCGLANPKIMAFFLRQTLLHINDTFMSQFEEKVDVVDIFGRMISNMLPCMQTVIDIGSSEDVAAIKEIKEKWCSYLGQEIDANKAKLLHDFLSKLFEPPYDLQLPSMPRIGTESFYQLHKQFTQVMEKAVDYGYVEKALKGS